jgi:hypothetical protein
MAIETKNFSGGLDYDTEDRLLAGGDYRYALNCRLSKSDGANQGSVENVKGNSLVSVTLPAGDNKTIGSFDDISSNRVIYCVFNSQGQHSIFEYNATSNIISLILRTPLLNFRADKLINDSFTIGGLYFFNDRFNQPRCINIDRAKTNGYPTPFKEEYMNVIVPAPGKPPVVEYGNDSKVKTNNVRGVLFQFRYKYTYIDNQESAWSPISKLALPIDEDSYRPFDYYPTDINNFIGVEFETGDDYVKSVKIAAREGNEGDFFLVTELERDKIITTNPAPNQYTYNFYNDEVYSAIDNDGFTGLRLFDWVPQLADSMSLIDGNRVAFGSITENYDPVDIDIEINTQITNSPNIDAPFVENVYNLDRGFNGYGVPTPPNGWTYTGPSTLLRKIGNITYQLYAGTQSARPLPLPTPLSKSLTKYFDNNTPGNPFDDFSKPAGAFGNRVLILESGGAGGQQFKVSESLLNEYRISAPTSEGTRYILELLVEYYDLGLTEQFKKEFFRFQYISVLGDTEADVAQNLVQQIKNTPVVKRGKVTIDFSKTEQGISGFTGSVAGPGQRIIKVWVEGVVKAADKEPDPKPSFPTAVGGDTAALYALSGDVDAYAAWTTLNKKTLKAGARHGLALVYYDGPNRSGLCNVSDERTFYVPFFTEQNIPSGSIPNDIGVELIIKHKAPSWAKRFQVLYTGNQSIAKLPGTDVGYKGFVQFKIKDVGTSSIPSSVKAELTNLTQYNDSIPEDVDLQYSFTKGDRIRIITEPSVGTQADYLNGYYDVEIISYDSTSKEIVFKDPGVPVLDNQMVEIYTPKKETSEVVYHEIGEVYDVVDGFHVGVDVDQTATNDAKLVLNDIGDVYLRYRVNPVGFIVEDYSFSDYYDSDYWDKGRPNIVDNNITRTKRESTIRFSGTYIPETNINGLSQFNDFDFEAYDQRYGSIEFMYSEDKDLTIFQQLKVGRIRIGQDTLYGNEGTQIATLKSQNKVLSDIVYYTGEYGIGNNPESFAVYGNRKYFTDVPRGAVLRLSTDGLTPISEFRMHNYFNDTFKRLVDSGNEYRVFGAYDVRFDEYVISIQENINEGLSSNVGPVPPQKSTILRPRVGNDDYYFGPAYEGFDFVDFNAFGSEFEDNPTSETVVPNQPQDTAQPVEAAPVVYLSETIAFSEVKKRWVTFYSYVPDYMGSNNISFLSYKGGELYLHNENPTYNNFYGDQYNQQIKIISNAEPNLIKFYNSIFIQSTSKFFMPEAVNQFGQRTSLVVEDFFDDEGVFKAAFLRDQNTPNVTNPLIEGDDMRCHSMTITLENNETQLVKLFLVELSLNPSLLTGK